MTIDFEDIQPAPRKLTPAEVEDQFRELLQAAMTKSAHTTESLSLQLGMTARNLRRILNGQQKLTTAILIHLGDALGIDTTRATCAIVQFGNWRIYYDAALGIAADILRPVVEWINQYSTAPIEPLHPIASGQLVKLVGERIVKHHEDLCARRRSLDDPD